MNCPKCLRPLESHVRTCPGCGSRVSPLPTVPAIPGLRIGTPDAPSDRPRTPDLPADLPPPIRTERPRRRKKDKS